MHIHAHHAHSCTPGTFLHIHAHHAHFMHTTHGHAQHHARSCTPPHHKTDVTKTTYSANTHTHRKTNEQTHSTRSQLALMTTPTHTHASTCTNSHTSDTNQAPSYLGAWKSRGVRASLVLCVRGCADACCRHHPNPHLASSQAPPAPTATATETPTAATGTLRTAAARRGPWGSCAAPEPPPNARRN